MRITNSLFYTNAVNNYQTNMQELYKTNTQIASGLKIQNSFEDSGIYVDTMRLNDEVASLEQVKESSSKAQTYANNTDGLLNQFTDALVQFKTKLIQASNTSNSPTSLGAIANELSALKDHMISLGNTSINGQYIFSGTAVTIKPLDSDGNYKGNDGSIEAIIGSGVKLPYNINGKELFLGQDSDYNKLLSTNVKMLNQTLLYPTGNEASQEVFLTENNTIQDMVGDSNVQVNAYDIAGTVEAGDVYSITINGIQISHTVTTETTSDEITTALMNKINDPLNNVATIVKATTNGSKLVLTSAGLESEPSIVTSVTNITNAPTSATITSTSPEVPYGERTIFSPTFWSTGDSISWSDGLGNSVSVNPATLSAGDDEGVIGTALAAAINTNVTTNGLYTASYNVSTNEFTVSNKPSNTNSFSGSIVSSISNIPATYSSTISNYNTASTVSAGDQLTWKDNLGKTYTYTASASDSQINDMLIGLTAKIDVAGVYNASYNLAGGFTITSNTAEYASGFSGSLTMDTGTPVVFGGSEVSTSGNTALSTATSTINGTPASATVTFSSTATHIDAGDIFSFTVDDGSGPVTFSYTSVSNDTLDNVKTNLEAQLALSTLYGGNGLNVNANIDEAAGTLSFEITGNYPSNTIFDGSGVITIDATGTVDTDTNLQTFTKDNAISSTSNEAIASFYVSGKNSIGDTFSKELQLSVGSKVSDLLKEIGQAYGNTSTNSVVDVSMNANGQIEIKDLQKGSSLLEFNIFGAIDRDAIGVVGNASQTDIDVLMAQNSVDIIKFDKSNFLNINTASSISSNQDINNPGVFKVGAPMTLRDGTPVETTTTLQSFMGDEVNQMNFSGTDNLGNPILPIPPNDVLKIDNTTTVGDLLTTIGNIYGSTARLENGQIIVEGDQSLDYAANQLTVKIDAQKGAGEGEIQSINITAGASNVNADIITVTLSGGTTQNVNIPAGGGTPDEIAILIAQELTANIPFASPDDNIASIRASGGKIVVDYNVSAGNISPAVISITNAGGTGILSGSFVDEVYVQPGITEVQSFDIKNNTSTGGPNSITIAGQSITINDADTPSTIATNIRAALGTLVGGGTIASVSGSGSNVSVTYVLGTGDIASNFLSPTLSLTGLNIGEVITEQNGVSTAANVNVFSTFDSMNYERRGFEKDGNLLSSNISQIVKDTSQYATNLTKLSDVAGTSLDSESLELNFTDKDGNLSKATINFSSSGSTFSINDGIEHDILNSSGTPTLSSNVTYQQLSDVISMAVSGVTYDSVFDATKYNNEYEENIANAKNSVEVNLNSKGQLEIYDKHNSKSKIEFSMFDPRADKSTQASSLTFMANDAVAIEKPKLDFFQNLDEMIVAVRSGNYNMDADSDNPRNMGMENSISRLDHIMDHITKKHTKIGSFSNALSQANDRSQLLSINIQTIRQEVIGVDIGEAYMKFNQLSNSYQAMLSTVAKINSMSLLNYM